MWNRHSLSDVLKTTQIINVLGLYGNGRVRSSLSTKITVLYNDCTSKSQKPVLHNAKSGPIELWTFFLQKLLVISLLISVVTIKGCKFKDVFVNGVIDIMVALYA